MKPTTTFLAALMAVVVFSLGCKKTSNNNNNNPIDCSNIYLCGTCPQGGLGTNYPAYWHNDTITTLTTGCMFCLPLGYATAICVDHGDVYVAGTLVGDITNQAVYWKNGIIHYLSGQNTKKDAHAYSMAVNNGDVYIGGHFGADAVYWKNDSMVIVKPDSNYCVYSIYVDGSDVYCAGGIKEDFNRQPFLYKNNTPLYNYSNNIYQGCFASVYSVNNNVYATGFVWRMDSTHNSLIGPMFFHNGSIQYLPDSVGYGEGYYVGGIGNDIYYAVNLSRDPDCNFLWHNGSLDTIKLKKQEVIWNMMIRGSDFYAFTQDYNIYKNGVLIRTRVPIEFRDEFYPNISLIKKPGMFIK